MYVSGGVYENDLSSGRVMVGGGVSATLAIILIFVHENTRQLRQLYGTIIGE
jgi:hypothetical protein